MQLKFFLDKKHAQLHRYIYFFINPENENKKMKIMKIKKPLKQINFVKN